MSPVDLEFLQKETKIVRNIKIPSPLKKSSTFQFVTVAADMDNVNKTHIYEGKIKVSKAKEISPEDWQEFKELKAIWGEEAWKLAQANNPSKFLHGDVAIIGSPSGSHHECSKPIEPALQKVLDYPTNQERLIVQTLNEGWQIGTMLMLVKIISTSIQQ